ncbi:DUF5519 family protein [soil metagenome]
MKLEEKGSIIPPPVLSKYSEIVSREIQQWAGIISATHWEIWDRNKPNGADFYVGESELGHIHLDGSLHVPSTKKFSKALIKAGLAQKFPYAEDWIQFTISDDKTAAHALWLFKLHYDHLKGADEGKLMQSILDYHH